MDTYCSRDVTESPSWNSTDMSSFTKIPPPSLPTTSSPATGTRLPSATLLDSQTHPVETFSLTKRIIAAVVASQLLLAVGLTLVAVLFARAQLRGAFNTALEGDALGVLALV